MRLALAVMVLLPSVAHAGDKKPPAGAKHIVIDYDYRSFHSNHLSYDLTWTKAAYRSKDGKTSLDGKLVDALYSSLTNLREFDDELVCMSHTDDFPSITISIEGDRPVTISTRSNCHANVPWNVQQNGKRYAQFTTDISKAAYKILQTIDPKNWKIIPDSPEASTAFGGAEYVALGAYEPAQKQASPAAMACVKDLASSEKVKKEFGENVTATELMLGCNLSTSADCTATIAAATFQWKGISLRMELPCSKGVIDVPTTTASAIADLKGFVDSKVVRLMVRMSGKDDAPRLWNNGTWAMQGAFEDGPTLSFDPATKHINIRAFGNNGPGAVKFFKALGIDAKKITKTRDGKFFETIADVDFNGRIVK